VPFGPHNALEGAIDGLGESEFPFGIERLEVSLPEARQRHERKQQGHERRDLRYLEAACLELGD
jgi:hypothetical protein